MKQNALFLIPKETFYNSKKEVIKNGEILHKNIFEEDRELYTYLLYLSSGTYYSKSIIIEKLLSNSLFKKEVFSESDLMIEDYLIKNTLFSMNTTYAIKTLLRLKDKKVNNNRTSKVILSFIFDRGNTDFIAVKYKSKLKDLCKHALGHSKIQKILEWNKEGQKIFDKYISIYENPYAKEVIFFLFGKEIEYKSEYLEEYSRIKKEFESNTFKMKSNLPIEVLIGFNNHYKRHYLLSNLITATKNVSTKQKIQLQNAVKRSSENAIELKIDYDKYNMMELLKYLYNKEDLTSLERKEIDLVLDKKTLDLIEVANIEVSKDSALILDLSESMMGSSENKMQPFFSSIILFMVIHKTYKLKYGKEMAIDFIGSTLTSNNLIIPEGSTDLVEPIVRFAKDYNNVIVISDGFNNVGDINSVYNAIKKLKPEFKLNHFNPVFSPRDFSSRHLVEDVYPILFKSEEDIKDIYLYYLLNSDETEFKRVIRSKLKEIINLDI